MDRGLCTNNHFVYKKTGMQNDLWVVYETTETHKETVDDHNDNHNVYSTGS